MNSMALTTTTVGYKIIELCKIYIDVTLNNEDHIIKRVGLIRRSNSTNKN